MELRRILAAVVVAVLALVLVPAADAARPVLSVVGGDLVDSSSGTPVPLQLRGVDRAGTEYACTKYSDEDTTKRGYAVFDGPSYDSARDSSAVGQESTLAAMGSWGVNAVRVPLSDACWFGEQNAALNTKYSGESYRRAVLAYVERLADRGIVAILSLHVASTSPASNLGPRTDGDPILLPMPERTQGPAFWEDVVQELASVPDARNVVLDLFNEPHLHDAVFASPTQRSDPWTCWRDGGCVLGDPTAPAGSPAATYTTAGMQQLVTAVREQERNTDSQAARLPRPLMLGGLDYANDLSGWAAHLPTDPRNALVASFHVYGNGRTLCADVACWDATVAPVRTGPTPHPVVTGEVGQFDCRADFLVGRYAAWADRQTGPGVSYLAWTWNAMLKGTPQEPLGATGWTCDHSPTLLKFNDGTPTDAYGLGYCQHLQQRRAALEPGFVVPQLSGPCPAARVASDPPADATPVPVPPAPPAPTAPPATSGTPTTTTPPTADPGPGVPPAAPPVPETTPAAPVVPPRAVPVEPRNVRITSSSLRLRRGKVSLKVVCTAGRTRCTGRIKVRTATRVALGRRRAVLVVLKVAFDVPAGRSATLVARPTADGRGLLRAVRRVKTVATVTSMGDLPMTRRLTLSR